MKTHLNYSLHVHEIALPKKLPQPRLRSTTFFYSLTT